MSFQLTRLRLNSSKNRTDKFIDQNILDWATTTVLQTIRDNMLKSGLSQNAANALSIEKKGFMAVELVWDYRGPNGEPLHFFIEEDTRPHEIRAKGQIAGGADVLRWRGAGGGFVFAKSVQHPGTKGKHLVKQGWEETKENLAARVREETSNKMEIEQL